MSAETITRRDKALAAQVILNCDRLDATPGRCPAWIESRGARCARPATEGLLCGRHHTVAERRLAAVVEKRRAEAAKRAADAAEKAPARRARLAVAEKRVAQLQARLSRPETEDTAAYGGRVNARIQARRDAAMARDIETGAELFRLTREAEELRRALGVTA